MWYGDQNRFEINCIKNKIKKIYIFEVYADSLITGVAETEFILLAWEWEQQPLCLPRHLACIGSSCNVGMGMAISVGTMSSLFLGKLPNNRNRIFNAVQCIYILKAKTLHVTVNITEQIMDFKNMLTIYLFTGAQ